MGVKSLLIIVTHPVQYLAPWFRFLQQYKQLDLQVWYLMIPDQEQQGTGFGRPFSWDIPLLDGYVWKEIGNSARNPNLDSFFGSRVNNAEARLRKLSPDAVLITGWHQYSLIQFARACNKIGIPCLIRGDSNNLKPRSWVKRWIHRRLLSLYQGFLYVGKANRDFYLDNGVAEDNLFFTPHFVDNDRYQQFLPDRDQTRRKWRLQAAIGEQEFVIGYVGKLQTKKNVAELLHGFAKLSGRVSDCCLVIVGDGVLSGELRRLAQQLQLRIIFTGFVNQTSLPAIYLACDCLVLPSDYGETWGLVINEAMNLAIPVVGSDRVGCGPDLIIQDKTGFCYPFGDSSSLASILESLYRNPIGRSRMGLYASRHIQNYSIQVASRGLLDALDRINQQAPALVP